MKRHALWVSLLCLALVLFGAACGGDEDGATGGGGAAARPRPRRRAHDERPDRRNERGQDR
jgi:hypothetical protein